MRDLHPDLLTLLRARKGVKVILLLWIVAKDRTTGAPVAQGFASGDEDLAVTIDGSPRTYAATRGALTSEAVVAETGMTVRMHTVQLSGVSAETETALRANDPRLAPAELHRIVIDPETGAAPGAPVLLFRGVVDGAPIGTPEKGGRVSVTLTLAASTRDMTRALSLKWSDASQQLRSGDRFARYADISGEVDVWWGAGRQTVSAPGPVFVLPTPKGSDK
jgi:hypothetical protein